MAGALRVNLADGEFGRFRNVVDVHELTVDHGAASYRVAAYDRALEARVVVCAAGGRHVKAPFVFFENHDVICLAKARGVLGDRVEDRLDVRRRARYNPQDLGRRGLLLQRLRHLCVGRRERPILLLEFREQPHVLDGDDGLVGEGLEQGEMLI